MDAAWGPLRASSSPSFSTTLHLRSHCRDGGGVLRRCGCSYLAGIGIVSRCCWPSFLSVVWFTNIQKHAQASKVEASLHFTGAEARLCIHDNGRGFDAGYKSRQKAMPEEGYGLRGIRERLELVGGSLHLESEPGRGTQLSVTVTRTGMAASPRPGKGWYALGNPHSARKNEAGEPITPALPATKANATDDALHTAGLTSREVEALRLIATGATNREVADALVISEGTVKNHLSNIFSRLGLRDRTQAVMYAREHGLL